MKRSVALILAMVLCLTFVGCVEVEEGVRKETVPAIEAATTAPATEENKELIFGLNEVAAFSALKFTATEFKESKGDKYFKPESGNVFVGVKFTIENISNEKQNVSSLLLFDGYVDDVKCAYSFSAACAFAEGTIDGEVAAGKKLIGWYALEVPADWKTIELDVVDDWLSDNTAKFVFTK